MISIEKLATVFVDVTDTLVDDFDAIEFLNTLTEHAAAISGADAVGLLLADQRGHLQYLASSNETGKLLERASHREHRPLHGDRPLAPVRPQGTRSRVPVRARLPHAAA